MTYATNGGHYSEAAGLRARIAELHREIRCLQESLDRRTDELLSDMFYDGYISISVVCQVLSCNLEEAERRVKAVALDAETP